jgi:UDP-3-O-[3-hydroxymyristoyl] glucosamine N-acyltransferase
VRAKSCTALELAEYLGATVEGNGQVRVSGLASPESAGPEDLIYAESPRHAERAAVSAAHCVLARPELRLPGKTVLRLAEPKLGFAKAAAWMLIPPRIAEGIHPTAVIASSARLGANVSVGPYAVIEEEVEIGVGTEIGAFCFVGRGSRIGENCRLYPHVTLYASTRLGQHVVIHAGSVIGGDGFGYVFGEGRHWKFPQIGTVEIGDDVEIGSNSTIDRGSLGETSVAAGAKIDNLVQIAHNVRVGENTVLAAQTGISGSSTVGRRVLTGGQVGVADHCVIEDGAIIGAQGGVPSGKKIRLGQLVWGTPARPLDRFKKQFAWFERLPELAKRVQELERQKVEATTAPVKNYRKRRTLKGQR